MKLTFIGPPGSGKGTVASEYALKHNLTHLSTGHLFRQEVQKQTDFGKKIEPYMKVGLLIPDDVYKEFLTLTLKNQDNYILDGFPRTFEQAKYLHKKTKLSFAIVFRISDDVIIDRLVYRRYCLCGATYNTKYQKPKIKEMCDKCHTKLLIRDDDCEDIVKSRIEVYREQEQKLIEYYKNIRILKTINATLPPSEIINLIEVAVKRGFYSSNERYQESE